MHQNKIDKINEEIQLLECEEYIILVPTYPLSPSAKQYDIPQGIKSAPATPPTTPPTLHIQAAKPDEGMSQGERVFEELLNTERDYLKELSAFCMKVLPSFKQVCYNAINIIIIIIIIIIISVGRNSLE